VGEDGCVGGALHEGGDLTYDIVGIEEPGDVEHVEWGVVGHERRGDLGQAVDYLRPAMRVCDPGHLVVAELYEANLSLVVEAACLSVNGD
jgi:hypothetical protein